MADVSMRIFYRHGPKGQQGRLEQLHRANENHPKCSAVQCSAIDNAHGTYRLHVAVLVANDSANRRYDIPIISQRLSPSRFDRYAATSPNRARPTRPDAVRTSSL